MGTNYYAHSDVCEHCGRSDEALHICKSHISFQAIRKFDPNATANNGMGEWVPWLSSWQTWKTYLSKPGIVIIDEYGQVQDLAEFIAHIESIPVEDRRRPYDAMMAARTTPTTTSTTRATRSRPASSADGGLLWCRGALVPTPRYLHLPGRPDRGRPRTQGARSSADGSTTGRGAGSQALAPSATRRGR